MPVTAKLSQRFYERFGEEIVNELVDWFNAVDATYRDNLRETNRLTVERLEARVDRRFAEFRIEVEQRFAEVRDSVAGVEQTVADTRADLVKWMFGFWIATLVPLAGLMVGLVTILH
jgi:hypothetical protein